MISTILDTMTFNTDLAIGTNDRKEEVQVSSTSNFADHSMC